MRKPDFFIVGAPKCGTSAMHRYLGQHPEIFVPRAKALQRFHYGKEIHYFGSDLHKENQMTLEDYLSFFEEASNKQRVGQAGVWLLYSREAAREIKQFSPEAQILIMLRNPVDMLYSLHSQRLYKGSENIVDFEAALNAEADRREGRRIPAKVSRPEGLLYSRVASFSEQVSRYVDVFGWANLHVIIYDDLKNDVSGTYRTVLRFLDVSEDFEPEFQYVNTNKRTRSRHLQEFISRPPEGLRSFVRSALPKPMRQRGHEAMRLARRLNTRYERRPPMDPELRRRLQRKFAPEVERLSELLGRDLTHWSRD